MMPGIDIQISDGARGILARLGNHPGLLAAVAREMDLQNDLTISHLVEHRLTGKGPYPVGEHRLGEATSLLRRSPRATKAVVTPTGVESSIGSNVKYAGLHEFGGVIHHKPRAGSVRLRTDAKNNLLRQGKNGKLAIFAKEKHKRAKEVQYQGKAYDVTYPARAPFWHAINDRAQAMGDGVSAAIIRFWNGGQPA